MNSDVRASIFEKDGLRNRSEGFGFRAQDIWGGA